MRLVGLAMISSVLIVFPSTIKSAETNMEVPVSKTSEVIPGKPPSNKFAQVSEEKADRDFWKSIEGSENIEDFRSYLEWFPYGQHVRDAIAAIDRLKNKAPADSSSRAASGGSSVYSKGESVIRGTFTFDFDTGVEGGDLEDRNIDMWWEQVTDTERRWTPWNGASFLAVGQRDFDSITKDDLVKMNFSSEPIDASEGPPNSIPTGSVVAGITSDSRYTKILIRNYGYDLHIKWVCYD